MLCTLVFCFRPGTNTQYFVHLYMGTSLPTVLCMLAFLFTLRKKYPQYPQCFAYLSSTVFLTLAFLFSTTQKTFNGQNRTTLFYWECHQIDPVVILKMVHSNDWAHSMTVVWDQRHTYLCRVTFGEWVVWVAVLQLRYITTANLQASTCTSLWGVGMAQWGRGEGGI